MVGIVGTCNLRRVLFADDQASIRAFAKRALSAAGLDVLCVANGKEAVSAARSRPFDIAVLDVQMPVMGGLLAATLIRQLPGDKSKIPIILTSGGPIPEGREGLADIEIERFVSKPYRFPDLIANISGTLNRLTAERVPVRSSSDQSITATMAELQELMGLPWVQRGLRELIDQIKALLANTDDAKAFDREILAEQAHRLASYAGLLGFRELAQVCSPLEQAARDRIEIVKPLASFSRAAIDAQSHANALLDRKEPEI